MKIGLIDVDGHNFPNLALMRISAYHKAQGDEVEWWWSDFVHYDIVYMSKIFSDAYSKDKPEPMNADKVIKAKQVPHNDERDYKYPANLKREYIPAEVFEFFDRMHDAGLTDEEVFSGKLNIMIGECPCVLGYGGIHGAIPNYVKEKDDEQ